MQNENIDIPIYLSGITLQGSEMNTLTDYNNMEIILANPRGFCAGVDRAIEIVERALELFGSPIYVRHEVVHNRYVVNKLKNKGAVFVNDLDEIPRSSTVIFSAHGVSRSVYERAKLLELKVFDATCPLVTKVHMEVSRFSKDGRETVLIGHKGHAEVIGTMGQYDNKTKGGIYLVESVNDVEHLNIKSPNSLAYVTQTTLSIDDASKIIKALQARFPKICGPKKEDICYATQNRQNAIKQLALKCDLVLVVGSPNSSNSNRLCEIAKREGSIAYLIDRAEDIKLTWLNNVSKVGVSAGASAPEVLVDEVVNYFRNLGVNTMKNDNGIREDIVFVLPKQLRK